MSVSPSAAAPAEAAVDGDLVSEVLAGRTARFGVLVRRHNQRLYRAARAILGDDAEAEDVVQDAYVRAFRALSTFRGEAAFSTWLTAIAMNSYRTALRNRPPAPVAFDLTAVGSAERSAFRTRAHAARRDRCHL